MQGSHSYALDLQGWGIDPQVPMIAVILLTRAVLTWLVALVCTNALGVDVPTCYYESIHQVYG
jgi:hypothetical protein